MAVESQEQVLGDFFTLQRGTTYKSRLLGQPGPILLGLGTIQRDGGFRPDSLRTYGGESPDKLLVRPGELYVSLKDVTQSADLLGAVARLPRDQSAGRLTQDTVKLEPKNDDVPLDYLYWIMRTPQYRGYCRAHATGTTNLGLAREDFLAFPVPARSSHRLAIVELLNTIDNKIELNRRSNETLEAMARALFKDWFVDFGPIRAKLEGREPYLAPELWSLFPDAMSDDETPKGWVHSTLADVALLNSESWTAKDAPSDVEYIDLANTKWGVVESTSHLAWSDAPSRARRILRTGDTIIGTVRPGNGSYCYIGRDGLTGSTGFAVLRPKADNYREFVYLAATAANNIDRLARLADGGAYPAVRPEVVAASHIFRPDENVIACFSNLISPMAKRIEQAKVESQALATLRDTLLPKLHSGELRVRDAERHMETAL